MTNDLIGHIRGSGAESPPARSTALPIDDQWLLVTSLTLAAVLIETSFVALLNLPVRLARFIGDSPDTWLPLLLFVALMGGAFALELSGRSASRERWAWIVAGAAGVARVVWFFRSGDVDWFATPDWTKEWTYYTALGESLSRDSLPWFLTESFQGTNRFFANAETNIAPHAVLLRWLDVPTFIVLQEVSFLVLGMVAAYHLARDLRLGPIASVTFLAIFLMNGHVVAHLETGHLQWVAYLLLPGVLLFTHRAALGDMSGRTTAGLALALALIVLVGGWHLFVWSVIFIGVFVVSRRSRWRFGAALGLLVAGLCAVRIVPTLLWYDVADSQFVGSYQRLSILVAAFVGGPLGPTDGLNWWEYNIFTGWTGLVVIMAGLAAPLGRVWTHSVSALWLPSLAMLVLSTYNIYEWTLFHLPGFVSQRVASRLLIVGVLGFALIGCVQLNSWLGRHWRSPWRMVLIGLAGLLMAAQLVAHVNSRRPRPDRGIGAPGINVVSDRRPEAGYAWSVGAGAIVTLSSFVIAIQIGRRRPATSGA